MRQSLADRPDYRTRRGCRCVGDVHSVIHGSCGRRADLNGEVQDDGLPRDSKLCYVEEDGRAGECDVFEHRRGVNARDAFNAPGEYELELIGNDGEKSSAVKVKVAVASPALTGGG